MRFSFTILLLSLFLQSLLAQKSQNFHQFAANTEAEAAAPLAHKLTSQFSAEKEKVSAIISWITENIAYQVHPWFNRPSKYKTSKFDVEDMSDTASILKPLNERIADLVIRRGEAYCDGYARLFTTLCDFSGIQSAVITGYSRTSMDKAGNKFRSNHTWNAVRIDSVWHLLDITWATGFVTYSGNEFVRRYDDQYIFTPPGRFINDHYPEDLKWTLLPQPPDLKEFNVSPFKQQGFVRTKITSYKPEKGLLNVAKGDTVYFEMETTYHQGEKVINNLFVDENKSSMLPDSQHVNWSNIAPSSTEPGKIFFRYVVQSEKVEYVNLFLNDHIIMRYRLKISNPTSVLAKN